MDIKRNGAQPSGKGKPMQTQKGWLLVAFLITLGVTTVSAQQLPSYIKRPSDASGVFAIYPGTGAPPGSEKWTWHEQTMQAPGFTGPGGMVRNVVIPNIMMFEPAAGKANGTSAIVAPGGAFRFLVAPLSVARLYEAWRKADKPVELHIFTKGRHGFGRLKQNLPSDSWIDLFRNWLAAQGYLSPAKR